MGMLALQVHGEKYHAATCSGGASAIYSFYSRTDPGLQDSGRVREKASSLFQNSLWFSDTRAWVCLGEGMPMEQYRELGGSEVQHR